jgi:DNA-binding MarR family transcriptional regulator
MEHAPTRAKGHLIVAAVRVLEHKLDRPPSVDEVADLLGLSRELAGHLVRALETHGIVGTIKGPFDLRVIVADHTQIELLPAEETGAGFKSEVDEFHKRFEEKQQKLQQLFDSGEQDKAQKQRFADLEGELKKFKAPRPPNPFERSSD